MAGNALLTSFRMISGYASVPPKLVSGILAFLFKSQNKTMAGANVEASAQKTGMCGLDAYDA